MRNKLSLKYLVLILIIVLVLVYIIYGKFSSKSIVVIKPIHSELVHAVYASGSIEPHLMLPLGPSKSARLTKLLVDEGDSVENGSLLAEFENNEFKPLIIELEAKLDLAKKEYDRQKELYNKSATTTEIFERAKLNYQVAKSELNRNRSTQRYFQLFAPDSGRIISRNGEIGEFFTSGEPIFWFSGSDKLRATLEVDEEDIAVIEKGQVVSIKTDAFPDRIFEGTVQQITEKGNPVTRSFRVRVALEEVAGLMAGMSVEANILIKEVSDALVLPLESIIEDHVYILEQGRLVRKKVSTGLSTPLAVEVKKGLSKNDTVVLDANAVVFDQDSYYRPKIVSWK